MLAEEISWGSEKQVLGYKTSYNFYRGEPCRNFLKFFSLLIPNHNMSDTTVQNMFQPNSHNPNHAYTETYDDSIRVFTEDGEFKNFPLLELLEMLKDHIKHTEDENKTTFLCSRNELQATIDEWTERSLKKEKTIETLQGERKIKVPSLVYTGLVEVGELAYPYIHWAFNLETGEMIIPKGVNVVRMTICASGSQVSVTCYREEASRTSDLPYGGWHTLLMTREKTSRGVKTEEFPFRYDPYMSNTRVILEIAKLFE